MSGEVSDPVDKPEHKKNGRVVPAGIVQTVNERIDPSVFRRCQRYLDAGSKDYCRPASLLEWARRKNLDLEKIIAGPEPPPEFTAPVNQPGID